MEVYNLFSTIIARILQKVIVFMELPRIVQESVKKEEEKLQRILESGELELISATFPFTEVLQVES